MLYFSNSVEITFSFNRCQSVPDAPRREAGKIGKCDQFAPEIAADKSQNIGGYLRVLFYIYADE